MGHFLFLVLLTSKVPVALEGEKAIGDMILHKIFSQLPSFYSVYFSCWISCTNSFYFILSSSYSFPLMLSSQGGSFCYKLML